MNRHKRIYPVFEDWKFKIVILALNLNDMITRRSFITKGAAVAAAAIVTPSLFGRETSLQEENFP